MNNSSFKSHALSLSAWAVLSTIATGGCLYVTSVTSLAGLREPPSVASTTHALACDVQTFQGVTPDVWDCFKVTLRQHYNSEMPAGDSGKISGRVTADYSWDRNNRTLNLTIRRRPFFVSCEEVMGRVSDFIDDCRGPQVSLVKKEGRRETWRVEAPDVKQQETAYPQITFGKGDTVSVEAGGCVQTGGRGKTWRRYVDPTGPDSDHLYHGLVKLPGMANAVRLGDFMTTNSYRVPNNAGGDLSLRLGYEDDSYQNNGYWGHDDGVNKQCKDVGKAWVNIVITRARR